METGLNERKGKLISEGEANGEATARFIKK
jgi:hypothetical protein